MRIIAGISKGTIIKSPKGLNTRPTTDKVREAIFSSIADFLEEARVLDLYAGSGALGLEAISRGAKEAFFVDFSYESIKAINQNIAKLGFSEKTKVIKGKVETFLKIPGGDLFDLIFIDAPYKISVTELTDIIDKARKKLAENGLLVVEHSKKTHIADKTSVEREKTYGQTTISYHRHSAGNV